MAKVFSLIPDNVKIERPHWGALSQGYGPAEIEKIPNPDGDFAKREPTSIPSPFARMDLVRTAFKYVTDKGQLEGNTIYHKLVSDCLDVGVLFFKFDSWPGLQLKTWSKNVDLPKLINSVNPRHKLYGETLDLFMKQDSQANNFNKLEKMYFIVYDHKIVGGTSPSTLFFTSANSLDFARLSDGNDVLFDSSLKALHQRDPEFQKFLHLYFKAHGLTIVMREVSEYLIRSLMVLDKSNHRIYEEIKEMEGKDMQTLQQNLFTNYDELNTGTANDLVEIIGFPLRKKRISERGEKIETESQLIIDSDKYNEYLDGFNQGKENKDKKRPPLVLQNKFSKRVVYTDESVVWEPTYQVPYFDRKPMNERTLPHQPDKYPYLTVSDFLEPFIIRLPYPINNSKFYCGNLSWETNEKGKSYLLPLSKTFFDFFNPEDLISKILGTPEIDLAIFPNSVKVTLKIPVKYRSGLIVFERDYENQSTFRQPHEDDLLNNKGYITDAQFGISIYPDIKLKEDQIAHYRVIMIDRDDRHMNYKLKFFQKEQNLPINNQGEPTTKRSSKEHGDPVTTSFFAINKGFTYAQVSLGNEISGVIIPTLRECNEGKEAFKFAVDFGTTNTHIEYKVNSIISPFEITPRDMQIATLHDTILDETGSVYSGARIINELIPHEFLPEVIISNGEFGFPQRTAVSHHKNHQLKSSNLALADLNISFVYERQSRRPNSKTFTNLKWSNFSMDGDDFIRVNAFLEQLIFLMRSKVLINNGRLDLTEIVWFYPSSMSTVRRGKLEKAWKELYKKYISATDVEEKVYKLSESIAPFYFFKENLGVDAAHNPVANIDIGGGTTDIVIYRENKPEILSSFRFAANSVFGGSYEMNGFVKKYLPKIKEQLKETKTHLESRKKTLEAGKLGEIQAVLDQIVAEKKPEDIVNYFFAIETNGLIQQQNIPISFNKLLANDSNLKIVFIVFYAAIIYHLAKVMKTKHLPHPAFITFSGTGSKLVGVADDTDGLVGLHLLTKLIFEKVYEKPLDKIKLRQYQGPKEITCKGGLLSDSKVEIDNIKAVLLGDSSNSICPPDCFTYSEVKNDTKMYDIVDEVKRFAELLFSLQDELDFADKFEIKTSMLGQYKAYLTDDLITRLKSGLESYMKEQDEGTASKIEEPLFFIPLVGALRHLACEIVANSELKT